MKVLLDSNLSPEIARGINYLLSPQGHLIIAKKDKFGDTRINDVVWIQALEAEGGWSFISLDIHIRRRPHERAVLRGSKVTAYFMAPAWQKFSPIEQAGQLMMWWPKLEKAFKVSRSGTNFWLPWKTSTRLTRLKS